MFYALENALQETGCLTEYINEGSQNSYDRFRNLIHYFSELLVEKFKDLKYSGEVMEEMLLDGADSAFVPHILLGLGFSSQKMTLLDFLETPLLLATKDAFAAVLGLVGEDVKPTEPNQVEYREDSFAHFMAWISAETHVPVEGYILDSLRAHDEALFVDLASWIKKNEVPIGKVVLERSSIILILKKNV
jgi:hypothetical protein